jgi:hypothetical protein
LGVASVKYRDKKVVGVFVRFRPFTLAYQYIFLARILLALSQANSAEIITPIKTAKTKLCRNMVITATSIPTKISCLGILYNSKTNPFKGANSHHNHDSTKTAMGDAV